MSIYIFTWDMFYKLKSCTLMGSTRSGSDSKGATPTPKTHAPPQKFRPE